MKRTENKVYCKTTPFKRHPSGLGKLEVVAYPPDTAHLWWWAVLPPCLSAVLSHPPNPTYFPQPLFGEKRGGRLGLVPDPLQSSLLQISPVIDGFSQPWHSWSTAVTPLPDFNRHTECMGTYAGVHTACTRGTLMPLCTQACEHMHVCPCLRVLIIPFIAFLPFKLPLYFMSLIPALPFPAAVP